MGWEMSKTLLIICDRCTITSEDGCDSKTEDRLRERRSEFLPKGSEISFITEKNLAITGRFDLCNSCTNLFYRFMQNKRVATEVKSIDNKV